MTTPVTALSTVGQSAYKQVFGVYAASIVNNNDPLSQGRVQLLIPQVLGTAPSNWADRVGLPIDNQFAQGLPTVGQTVLAAFEGGDINRPCYFPGGWNPTGSVILSNLNIPANKGSHFGVDGGGLIYLIHTFGTSQAALAQVVGETTNRWQMNTNGNMQWGPGGVANTDTNLYRSGVSQLASDNIVKNISGVAETWHAMTLLNSWLNTGGSSVTAQYRLDTDNSVWIVGDISSGAIGSPTTIATLPAGYRPNHSNSIPLMIASGASTASANTPVAALDGTGNIQVFNIPTGTNRIIFNGKIRLDA